jgi:hypothetical protein
MKYQDRTFCTGGTPCCAHFSKCPKALTPEHQSRAAAHGLPVAKFAAPTSMPCYVDPAAPVIEAPPPPPPPASKQPKWTLQPERRPPFFIKSVPEKRWRKLFSQKPIRSNMEISKIVGCSDVSVRTMRTRLGFPPYPTGGFYRRKYDRADAEKLAKKRRPGESMVQLAERVGMTRGQIHHIAALFRDLFPAQGGNAGRSRR